MVIREFIEPSFPITLWIAGELAEIKQYVRQYCNETPMCVTITETEFIYVGGQEKGARIGFAHYPRFPLKNIESTLVQNAYGMAKFLIEKCYQRTALIETRFESIWVTTMDEDEIAERK